MKRLAAMVMMALSLLAVSAAAQAQIAYTTKDAHLRAGPRRDYPVVAILPAGMQVAVQGCLSDYSWCDVIAGVERGWVYAGNLDYVYQNAPLPLLDYGPQIGIVVIPFVLGDYWGHFYRDRPWYPDRDRWLHQPRPPRPIGPGRPPHPPPGAAPAPPAHQPRIPRPVPGPRSQSPGAPAPGRPHGEPSRPGAREQPRPPPSRNVEQERQR